MTATPEGLAASPLLGTGVPGLDLVLGGGFRRAGLYLIEGRAGGGKTILASQIAFHRATCDEKVLYVTVLAEDHGKLLEHLRAMTFFNEAAISTTVQMMSGYQALIDHGLDGLLKYLMGLIQEHAPALLVVDGFRAATMYADTDKELSRFIHQLDNLVSGARCTTLLLSPTAGVAPRTEHTLVDGLIELSTRHRGLRRSRLVEVHKLRGSAHMSGRHLFRITDGGLHVFPRFEARLSTNPPAPPQVPGRVTSGVQALDAMMGGGVMPGSTTAILGAPGAGKTLLGLSFLKAGLDQGEPCAYFGFYESPERVVAKAAGVGLILQAAADAGLLSLQWQPPLELYMDELGERLLRQLERIRATRLFIDGVEGFRDAAAFPDRFRMFITALTVQLRAAGVTTYFSQELPLFGQAAVVQSELLLSAVVENILRLRYVERRRKLTRLISVMKMRENSYDHDVREFRISDTGFYIEPRVAAGPASPDTSGPLGER